MTPPPIPNRDVEHIRLLAVFHYVVGALSFLGIAFLFGHYYLMRTVFGNPELWKNAKEKPPFDPQEMLGIFVWMYVAFGVIAVIAGTLNIASGHCLRKRSNRMFSMVVAGLNCIQIPFGTVLGVFTLVVLSRDSVLRLYERSPAPAALPDAPPPPLP